LICCLSTLLSEGFADCVFVQYAQNYYQDGNDINPLWKFSIASQKAANDGQHKEKAGIEYFIPSIHIVPLTNVSEFDPVSLLNI